MAEEREGSQLVAIFTHEGRVTCTSAEEYSAFIDQAAELGFAVDVEVDADTGDVTFTPAVASASAEPRELDQLVATLHERGSLVLLPQEYPAFEEWVRANNVPVHRQVDRKLGRIVVIKRGWGTVEA